MKKTNPPISSLTTHKANSLKKESNRVCFNYIEYFKEIKEQLGSYKLTELKEITKFNKIKGAKTKQEHITKIHDFFIKTMNAIKIQKVCRGFFVRMFFKAKGDASKITECVNETDFYTLEPLSEINYTHFFIIKEVNDQTNIFYYGFNIFSLITMYRKNDTIINPYNRQTFPIKTIQDIFSHYQLLLILFKETAMIEDTIENIVKFKVPSKYQIQYQFGRSEGTPTATTETTPSVTMRITRSNYRAQLDNTITPLTLERLVMEEIMFPTPGVINTYIIHNFHTQSPSPTQSLDEQYQNRQDTDENVINETEEVTNTLQRNISVFNDQLENTAILENIRNKIIVFKQQPINTRINEIFMYIDQLGNYTNATWFSELNKRKYYIFYSQLRELWTFRAQIPNHIKNRICPFGDPFIESSDIFRKPYDQITEDEIIRGCLDVIENIIMSSTDVEYRKIGCLHVLTALTVVSPESRLQYGYLFDLVDSMPLQHTRFNW